MKAGFDNIQAHVPDDLAKVINDLAEKSGLTKSKYVRSVLEDAARRRVTFKQTIHQSNEHTEKAA